MSHESQTVEIDCCPSEPVNHKKELLRRRAKPKALELYKITNPIVDEVRDTTEIQNFFKRWNFVPYAGTTTYSGQMLLYWYLMLAKLSPTHNACISKKLKYAVGGKGTFIRSEDPEWDTGEEQKELSPAEKVRYRDVVNEFIEFQDGVGKFHRRIGWSYEAVGDAWIEMTYSEVMGVGRVHLRAHKVTNCLYVKTEPGEMRIVAVSPIWEESYLEKHEPRYVPEYPVFEKDSDGTLRTMFHLKNGDNSWYGRPESQGADLYKYREVQDAMYLIKQAGANFTGQLIIEVEDDDPDTNPAIEDEKSQSVGYDGFTDRFERNYTNKADDPQSVLVTARPFGSRPMFVFQVEPNTNEQWYKVTGEIAEQKIMQAHGCTPRFMGKEVSAGFSQDVYISDYVTNMEPVIDELRNELTKFTNAALTAAWLDLLKKPEMNEVSITFTPPIQGLVSEYKKSREQAGLLLTQQQAGVQNKQSTNEPDNSVRGTQVQPGGV